MKIITRTLRTASSAILVAGVLASATAQAARDTEVVGFLHGELGAALQGSARYGRMTEDSVKVGEMSEGRTGSRFDLRFGVLPGLELFTTLPFVSSGQRSYSDVASMCGDAANLPVGTIVYETEGTACTPGSAIYPNPEEGTYVANPNATIVPAYTLRGMENMTLGLRFSPLHERQLGSFRDGRKGGLRPFPPLVTWRLELGVLLNTGTSFYDGGTAAGAGGVRLGTSFSKRLGVADPYFSLTHSRYGTFQTSFGAEEGGEAQVLTPPDETELLFGVELTPYEEQANGARFTVDFAGGGYLLSESTVISGTVLPSVVTSEGEITGSNGDVVRQEAQTAFQARLRLHYQVFRYLRLQASGSLAYGVPHRLEAPYDIVLGRKAYTRFSLEIASTF